jgi:KDO2-lipid IV(A) lauroyltransferase
VCERLERGHYRVSVIPAGEDLYSEDADLALAALNRGVEQCIAIDPAQYLWSYRRFRTRPEGERPVY